MLTIDAKYRAMKIALSHELALKRILSSLSTLDPMRPTEGQMENNAVLGMIIYPITM